MKNKQVDFWSGEFGKAYTDRNTRSHDDWNNSYVDKYGFSKLEINERALQGISREIRILEVGCNTGQQLEGLMRQGFENLYGVELQWYAVEKAKELLKHVNIIQGSGFDLPFKDGFFDLVMTNGVLIHIEPEDLKDFMGEIVRCSSKYVFGFEYYSPVTREITYRGNDGYLWKSDYCQMYKEFFPELSVKKMEVIPYIREDQKGNSDCLFLLEKK